MQLQLRPLSGLYDSSCTHFPISSITGVSTSTTSPFGSRSLNVSVVNTCSPFVFNVSYVLSVSSVFVEAVRGIPNLKIDEGKFCGECQIGKQTRMSHPMHTYLLGP